jgi:hypothetical protein
VSEPKLRVIGGDYVESGLVTATQGLTRLRAAVSLTPKCTQHELSGDFRPDAELCLRPKGGAYQPYVANATVQVPHDAKSIEGCTIDPAGMAVAKTCSCSPVELTASWPDRPPTTIRLLQTQARFSWSPPACLPGPRVCPPAFVSGRRCSRSPDPWSSPQGSSSYPRGSACYYLCTFVPPQSFPVTVDWSIGVRCGNEDRTVRWADRLTEDGERLTSYPSPSENAVCVDYTIDADWRVSGWRNRVDAVNVTLPTGETFRLPTPQLQESNQEGDVRPSHWVPAEDVVCRSPITYRFEGKREFNVATKTSNGAGYVTLQSPRELRARAFSLGFAAGGGR